MIGVEGLNLHTVVSHVRLFHFMKVAAVRDLGVHVLDFASSPCVSPVP